MQYGVWAARTQQETCNRKTASWTLRADTLRADTAQNVAMR